jgi:hypothetical protein
MRFRSNLATILAAIGTAWYDAKRTGVLFMLTLMLVQTAYVPVLRYSAASVFCHSSLLCDFPTCYSPPTFLFLAVAFLGGMYGGAAVLMPLAMFQYAANQKYNFVCAMARFHHPGDAETASEMPTSIVGRLTCALPDHLWQSILVRDRTLLKSVYHQYKFQYMWLHGPLLLFKLAQVLVVLYAGEPNSLTQLTAVSIIEVLQLVTYLACRPFSDPWIDALSKAGSCTKWDSWG